MLPNNASWEQTVLILVKATGLSVTYSKQAEAGEASIPPVGSLVGCRRVLSYLESPLNQSLFLVLPVPAPASPRILQLDAVQLQLATRSP